MTAKKSARKYVKQIGIYIIFGGIIVVFVGFGVERFANPSGGSAATVNGEAISISEYKNALQQMINMYTQLTQGNFDEEAQKKYRIREAALQQLVSSELIAQGAEKMGLRVTDQELADTIAAMPYFKKDGRFSKEMYDGILKSNRLSTHQFEKGLRKEALIEKARGLFDKNILINPLLMEKQAQLKSKKINLEFLQLSPEELSKKMTVSDAEAASFTQQKDAEAKIKEYYDLHQSYYNSGEQVRASHILIKAKKGNAVEEKAAAEKLKKVQSEIAKSGFATVVKKYSDDADSKIKGEELGWFKKGRMALEFEKTAFSLKAGETSSPVQTDLGFHIIKVEEKKAPKHTSLSDAKKEIVKKIVAEKKSDQLLAEGDMKVLQALGGKWQETGFFALSEEAIPKIGADDELQKDILKLDAKNPSTNKLYRANGQYYAVKFKAFDHSKTANAMDPSLDPALKALSKEVFSSWSSKLSEASKVEVNNQLFTDEGVASQPISDM